MSHASPADIGEIPVASETDIGQLVEFRDSVSLVLKLVDNLPTNQRDIIRMRDIADSPYDEIEEATGLSPANIRTLLSRARKKIKEQYTSLLNYERKQ